MSLATHKKRINTVSSEKSVWKEGPHASNDNYSASFTKITISGEALDIPVVHVETEQLIHTHRQPV